jgi:hypothetical protein
LELVSQAPGGSEDFPPESFFFAFGDAPVAWAWAVFGERDAAGSEGVDAGPRNILTARKATNNAPTPRLICFTQRLNESLAGLYRMNESLL